MKFNIIGLSVAIITIACSGVGFAMEPKEFEEVNPTTNKEYLEVVQRLEESHKTLGKYIEQIEAGPSLQELSERLQRQIDQYEVVLAETKQLNEAFNAIDLEALRARVQKVRAEKKSAEENLIEEQNK
jgi:hypothetical protein